MSAKDLTPEQEMQMADIESMGPGPFYMNQVVADACLAEYGRLPSNFVVVVHLSAPATVPAVVPTMLPYRGAQWKRERSGRWS
jgi:hypothetical protein